MGSLIEIIKRHHWDIGLIYQVEDKILDTKVLHIIKNPYRRKTWFADPFVLDVTDEYVYLLVEEYTYSLNRGRIAKLTINRKTDSIADCKVILDLGTHLSFPAIFRYQGSVYVYPENSESGKSIIYKYTDDGLKQLSVLAEEPLTDAVVVSLLNRPVVFSTRIPCPNGGELGIYESDSYFEGYHLAQKIKFSDNVARNAGDVFESDGVLIRPAQVCQGKFGYGLGICFQKVENKDGLIDFKELYRIFPPKGYDGMHTYNKYKGIAAVDLRKYNYPVVHSVLSGIKSKIFGK